MQKVIRSVKLSEANRLNIDNSQFVVFRDGDKIRTLNFEAPEAKMKFSKETGEFSLVFTLRDGDHIVIGDGPGFSSSVVVQGE